MTGEARAPSRDARRLALDALTAVRRKRAYLSLTLSALLDRSNAGAADRRLAVAIASGVMRRRRRLDDEIDAVSKTPVDKLEPVVRDALRIGLYQLRFLDRIPAHAAVGETVTLVPPRARGFVNAVLKTLAQGDAYLAPAGDDAASLARRYSVPDWLAAMWRETYGPARAERLLAAMQEEPRAVLRACGASADDVIAELAREGIDAKRTDLSPFGVVADNLDTAIASVPFREGRLTVQGEAAQLVTLLVDPRPGEQVLDACAAPGGKTTHIAERVGAGGRVVARDVHAGRLALVAENARRLGLANVETTLVEEIERDIDPGDTQGDGEIFDRVLVDAPCSGLGQLQKHPETRWLLASEDPARLGVLQRAILADAARHVRPGGRLVYATCTLARTENEDVVRDFLAAHADFSLVPAGGALAESVARFDAGRAARIAALADESGALQLLPSEHGTDGAFAVAMRRRE
ncbi:16S rRNA (cytosine(967)-C(5))-methyltransferase RsmB [bacterium]|nr:16S rRNA (cytosine(967)-C(5))-methyltransferase RsmB [bacterium]